ncbi:BrnA antitoxin family protein [Mailhella massiliensis]|jgi:uncharacterized protein (DUF4415 family)|uniref:BrnA antitoxin family protein n=1 Tax=Mailhella massiliensis TaxID=1903261 RepID=A0A921AX52_9BACT|nr:BrnA antitoxin family protein [Mailhella massiliensis]HJD97510.1 BrnA antitoxin family protein [Mailhella massiliensis]
MKHPEENIVSYSAEELERLPRLDGARRPMSDEEITRAMHEDPDAAPELTEEMMASARPAHEVLPEIFPADVAEALLKKRGRPKSERPKIQFTARFDADIVEHFRKTGKGWQVRMEEVLRKAIAMGL